MASTLIVRDATLAINGAADAQADPRERLRHRVAEVCSMDLETVAACVEVLRPMASGDDVALDVLEAMTILGVSHPNEIQRIGVSPLVAGRRFAARLEQSGAPDRAMATLELLLETFPNQGALERDMTALMRRQGMVKDLIERYNDRAQRLLREGKTHEAIGWLKEILLLDDSRKDVARLIRNLRLKRVARPRGTPSWLKTAFLTILFGAGIALVALRERRLRGEFDALPAAQEGSLASMERRLDDVESFIEAHPIWHGAFSLLAERSSLRIGVERLREEAELMERAHDSQELERLESANLIRTRARGLVESGKLEAALEDLRLALELGPPDWEHRERVEADIDAITQHLEETR